MDERTSVRRVAAVALCVGLVAPLLACSDDAGTDAARGSDLVPTVEEGSLGRGVTDDEIKIAFHLALEPCGDNPDTAGAYVTTQQYRDEIDVLVRWFNEHVDFPGGRRLVHEYVDDGGPNAGCEDVARAAALRTTEEIGAFAALGSSTNFGGASVFAQEVTAQGTVHIAPTGFQLARDLTDRWPFAWGVYPIAEESLHHLAGYVANRADTPYVDADGAEHERRWGALFFDDPLDHELSDLVVDQLEEDGIEVTPYFVSPDDAVAGQQAVSLAAQMKADGVNSVVFGVHGVPGVSVAKSFDGQAYFPDNFISDYGAFGGLTVLNSIYGEQRKRFQGISLASITALRVDVTPDSSPGESARLQENNTGVAATTAYHDAGGPLPSPFVGAPLNDFWVELSTLALGILGAGETLNARTFAEGLESASTCEVERFFGVAQEQAPLVRFSRDRPWAYHGFTTVYWTEEPSAFGTPGFFESSDGYRRFDDAEDLPDEPSDDTGERGDYPRRKAPEVGRTIYSDCER